jgi:outer membrane protein OmpA-like peptidoglycan-associated protein
MDATSRIAAAVGAFAALMLATSAHAQSCPPGASAFKLYFDAGSASIDKASGYPILAQVFNRAGASGHLTIEGHTDGAEPEALAAERTRAVSVLMIAAGMHADRMTLYASGFKRPAVNSPGSEPLNRRVEMCVTG